MLAIMLGPIFITLTQIAIEKGARAGLVACIGVWISDIIIVSVCYIFVQKLSLLVHDATFTYWMGLVGGFVLIAFGAGALFKEVAINFTEQKHSANDYLSFFNKGFLINTINPFTFLFWITVISSYVFGGKESLTNSDATIFFSTIIIVIMLTDTVKVVLAKLIRNKLKLRHFKIFTRVAGFGLIAFGVALLLRSNVV